MRLDKLTIKSQEALQQAHTLAEKRNHQAIDAEHLLFALMGQKEAKPLKRKRKRSKMNTCRRNICCSRWFRIAVKPARF